MDPEAPAAVAELLKQEEYKTWKKNSPFLYDVVITHALEWPSLTVQFFPDKVVNSDQIHSTQRLLLGTHTAEGEPNSLLIAEVCLPLEDVDLDVRSTEAKQEDDKRGKIEIKIQIPHDGEVNRARYMPQNPNIIATMSAKSSIFIFDKEKHESKTSKDAQFTSEMTLTGHTKEGYGLSWSPHREGLLLSGAEDAAVCVWDITMQSRKKDQSTVVNPLHKITGHSDVVEEVAWHQHNEQLFGSCGDDRVVNIWDLRDPLKAKSTIRNAHPKEVNCMAFNPFNEFTFLTGSADQTICLWDLRNLKNTMHTFHKHTDQVMGVQWSPFQEQVFSSYGADRRVNVWDLSRIGREQDPEDAEDGPPELLFIHGGHTEKVSDMSWNPNDEWVIATVDDANVVQVWQMAENIYNEDEAELEGGEKPDEPKAEPAEQPQQQQQQQQA